MMMRYKGFLEREGDFAAAPDRVRLCDASEIFESNAVCDISRESDDVVDCPGNGDTELEIVGTRERSKVGAFCVVVEVKSKGRPWIDGKSISNNRDAARKPEIKITASYRN